MDHPEDKLNRNMKTPWLNGIYGCIIQAVIIFRKQKMYSATQRVDNLEVFKMDVSGAGRNEVSRSRVPLQHLHSIYLLACGCSMNQMTLAR